MINVAVLVSEIDSDQVAIHPWILHREDLGQAGIRIRVFEDDEIPAALERPFHVVLPHLWQDYRNLRRYRPDRILPILGALSRHRIQRPNTI